MTHSRRSFPQRPERLRIWRSLPTIEGEWAERVTGLRSMRVEVAMMPTTDGHIRLELSLFLIPPEVADHRNAPVNALGYLPIMFAVDDIDETLARLRKPARNSSAQLVQYKDAYRLCYIRGPEAFLIGLAEKMEFALRDLDGYYLMISALSSS